MDMLRMWRMFLSKPARVELTIQDATHPHGTPTYRLPAPLAASGILLHPFLRDTADVGMLAIQSGPLPGIERFTLNAESGFQSTFTVRFKTTKIEVSGRLDPIDLWEPVLGLRPGHFEGEVPLRWHEMKGETGLCMQAPSKLRIAVPEGTRILRGRFGVDRGAFRDDPSAKGTVLFKVTTPDGATLWEKTLDPIVKKSHRGWLSSDVAIPDGTKVIELQVLPDTEPAQNWQHGLWTGLEFSAD